MNKTDIITSIASETNRSKSDVAEVVNAVFDQIASALVEGEKRVAISRFGTFTAKMVDAHDMTTPLNGGGVIHVDRSSKVQFSASDKLKERVTKANKAPRAKKS